MDKKFTIFIATIYAPRTQSGELLITRCLQSLLKNIDRDKVNIFVGANCIDESKEGIIQGKWEEPRKYLQGALEKGDIDLLVISPHNTGKEGIYSILMQHTDTEFVIRLDDDTHFHAKFLDELEEEISYDTENLIGEWGRIAQYVPLSEGENIQNQYQTALSIPLIKKQSWYKGKPILGIPSCSGGFVCSRAEALRAVNYPHCSDEFEIYAEDIILAAALSQNGWLVRNAPLFWNRDIVSFGDESGVGSRTDRTKPRKVWDGNMDGIEVYGDNLY